MESSGDDGINDNADESPKGQYNQNNQEESLGMGQQILNILRSAAFWTVIFTGLLTLFTYKLYDVSKKTSETSVSSERAFVILGGPQLGVRLVDNPFAASSVWQGQEVYLMWANAGNTPARDVILQTSAKPFFPDLPSQYDFPLDLDSTHAVIGPKGGSKSTVKITREMLSDAVHEKKRLFVWGTATYKDVFPASPERLTEFCIELTHLTITMLHSQPPMPTPGKPTSGKNIATVPQPSPTQQIVDVDSPMAVWNDFQWQQCPAHNCYDEDCPDYAQRAKPTNAK